METYTDVDNGVPFDLTGRYLQIRVRFEPNDENQSPVLFDISLDEA